MDNGTGCTHNNNKCSSLPMSHSHTLLLPWGESGLHLCTWQARSNEAVGLGSCYSVSAAVTVDGAIYG